MFFAHLGFWVTIMHHQRHSLRNVQFCPKVPNFHIKFSGDCGRERTPPMPTPSACGSASVPVRYHPSLTPHFQIPSAVYAPIILEKAHFDCPLIRSKKQLIRWSFARGRHSLIAVTKQCSVTRVSQYRSTYPFITNSDFRMGG